MAEQKWQCERCGALYGLKEIAVQCESDHKDRERGAHVKRFGWEHDAEKPGDFPTTVVIKFSNNDRDFATYRIQRISFEDRYR